MSSGLMGRTVFDRLKEVGRGLKQELKVYQLVLKDKRTPKLAKVLLGLVVGYTLMPFDIIPDFIPVIGHLDDVIIVPGLMYIALKIIPKELVEEHRAAIREA
jgi:uncharacterized membrane protein YkvA (DUF1232 family)